MGCEPAPPEPCMIPGPVLSGAAALAASAVEAAIGASSKDAAISDAAMITTRGFMKFLPWVVLVR